MNLKFSGDYPSSPLIVRFISKIYHPNVHGDDDICLNVPQQEWPPALDVTILQKLLNELNAADPIDAALAEENKNDFEGSCENVREATADNEKKWVVDLIQSEFERYLVDIKEKAVWWRFEQLSLIHMGHLFRNHEGSVRNSKFS